MMEKKLNINEWAVEDRPREKMMLHGVGALSDAELLAILIGSGNREETAVELMRRILCQTPQHICLRFAAYFDCQPVLSACDRIRDVQFESRHAACMQTDFLSVEINYCLT